MYDCIFIVHLNQCVCIYVNGNYCHDFHYYYISYVQILSEELFM